MDPTTIYKNILSCIECQSFEDAKQQAEDLQEWLNKGGFYPVGYDKMVVIATLTGLLQQGTL